MAYIDINAPDRSRTCNHRIRSPVLYPIELRALNTDPYYLTERKKCKRLDSVAKSYCARRDSSAPARPAGETGAGEAFQPAPQLFFPGLATVINAIVNPCFHPGLLE